MLAAFPVPAAAQLSPTAEPSAMARSDIPPNYLSYYTAAAKTCPGLPWQVLAAIGSIESDHGRSSAPDVHGPAGYGGPEGPMQFEAPTFAAYAVRADDGPASPYNPKDAIYSAARMLCADGGGSSTGLYQAIYMYNHAGWYVNDVLNLAQRYSGPPAKPAGHPAATRHPHPSVRPAPAPKAPEPHAGAHSTCGSPDRIRTGVTALRGRRPRPLDDGAVPCPSATRPGSKPAISSGVQTTASPPARPTGTPTPPSASPTPAPAPSPSASPTATSSAAPTPTPSVSPSLSPTPTTTTTTSAPSTTPVTTPSTTPSPQATSPSPASGDLPTPAVSLPSTGPSFAQAVARRVDCGHGTLWRVQ